MGRPRRNLLIKAFLLAPALALFSLSALSYAEEQERSLIRQEMVALDRALKVTVDAIVLNELEKIPPAFEEVHRIRHKMEETLHRGKEIVLPRNQKRFKEFVRMDNKFHHDIELLLKAAKKNSMVTVRRQTHRLIDACVRCHAVFRR